jgi:hypothetical protein
LPDASALPPDRPARLMLIVGALEFPSFRAEAESAAGPGRSIVVVPGVEHISVLYAPRTHQEIADWLGGDTDATGLPSPIRRMTGAALLLLALLAGLYPLARLLFGCPQGSWPRLPSSGFGRTVVVGVLATAVAALIAPLLPSNRLPLAVGGYVVGFTAVAGVALLGYHRRRGSSQPVERAGRLRLAVATPVLLAYAMTAIALPTHLGLTHAVPVGARWWLLALVWAGFAVLAYAAERVTGGNSIGVLTISALAMIALTGAAILGLTSGFVLLVVPLLAVLLGWQAIWSAMLHRFAAPTWLIALVGSLVVAWPIATALPVIS